MATEQRAALSKLTLGGLFLEQWEAYLSPAGSSVSFPVLNSEVRCFHHGGPRRSAPKERSTKAVGIDPDQIDAGLRS